MNINLTLIGQAISFAIFVWFCMKYVWPPITSALEKRKKTIADGLAAAEKGQQSLENAKVEGKNLLVQYSKISNKDIKKKGEDLKKNKILIKKNEKIDFIKIALLSSVGITNLWVYKTLRVAVVSSGNELIKSGKKIKDHQVYDSNKYQIIHFLKNLKSLEEREIFIILLMIFGNL